MFDTPPHLHIHKNMADFGHQGKRGATKTIGKDKVIRIFKQKQMRNECN